MKKLRQLYHWVLEWADHRHNTKALAFVAAIESIFFPVPPDALLLAMGARQPKKAYWYAFLSTAFSVLGGIIGYAVGLWFWHLADDFFYAYVFKKELFDLVQLKFQENALAAMFVAAFTPIPFKVFTLAAGAAEISLPMMILGSVVGRGMRFFLLGGMIYHFGTPIMGFIEKYFEKLVVGFSVLLFLAIGFYKWVF